MMLAADTRHVKLASLLASLITYISSSRYHWNDVVVDLGVGAVRNEIDDGLDSRVAHDRLVLPAQILEVGDDRHLVGSEHRSAVISWALRKVAYFLGDGEQHLVLFLLDEG